MQVEIWKIAGHGFHFGQHGLDQEESMVTFPSDSLFAALISVLAAWRGGEAVKELMQPFLNGRAPFVLTSTFPRAGDVRFFPAPLVLPQAFRDSPKDRRITPKKAKRIRYLSEKLFFEALQGKPPTEMYPEAKELQGGKVWISEEEFSRLPKEMCKGKESQFVKIWEIEKRPRVTLQREDNLSNIYHTGRVTFAPDCGLWFGVRWVEQGFRPLVHHLFSLLADAGLGGERSTGFGVCHQFELWDTLDWRDATGSLWVNLSRYLPKEDEMKALTYTQARYRLVQVGGWLVSPTGLGQRRKNINLIEEGAVLGALDKTIPGQIVDVQPEYSQGEKPLPHEVYRCGLAFSLPYYGGVG